MPAARLRAHFPALPDLPRDTPRIEGFTLRQQASVAVLLRATDPVDLLFIKRAENPRDPWSGHMALPGGRREEADVDLLGTAIRETREETGITLDPDQYLGRLPFVAPRGPTIPRVVVVPYLFAVPGGTTAIPGPGEVQETGWVSVDHLRAPDTLGELQVELPNGRRTFPTYRVGSDVIWGMTYRIVEDLLLTLEGVRLKETSSPPTRR